MEYLLNGTKYYLIPFRELTGKIVREIDAVVKQETEGKEFIVKILVRPEEILFKLLRTADGKTVEPEVADHITPEQQLTILADLLIDRMDFLANGGKYFEDLLKQRTELQRSTQPNSERKTDLNQTPAPTPI